MAEAAISEPEAIEANEKTVNKTQLHFSVILMTGFINYLGIGLVYPVFSILLFDTNQSIVPLNCSSEYRGAILGVLIGLTPISQFFCSPLLGALSDIQGRRRAFLIGVGLGCISYAAAITAISVNSITLLFLYRVLLGASDATAAVGQAALTDMSTQKNKSRRFYFFNSALSFGFTLGPFFGGILADSSIISWFSCSTPFIIAGVLSFINLLMILWKFPETRKNLVKNKFYYKDILVGTKKSFLIKKLKWLFIGGFALSFGWAFFNEFIPVLLRERFGFTLFMIGKYYAFTGGWYALGALIAGLFINRFSLENVAIVSSIITAICMLSFVVVTDATYIWWIIPWMLCCLSFIFPAVVTMVSNRTSAKSQGEVLGVYHSLVAAAMGLSPLLGGFAIGAYPILTAWGGGAFLGITSVAIWISKKHKICQIKGGDNHFC